MFAYSVARGTATSGFLVVTDRFVCLLGPAASAGLYSSLYRILLEDAARIEDALDLIVAQHDLDRFAIVEVVDPATSSFRIAVRGSVLVDLEGATTRLTGTVAAAWPSSEVSGVIGLRLALDTVQDSGESLPLGRGVVEATVVALEPEPVPEVVPTHTITGTATQGTEEGTWIITLPDGTQLETRQPIVIGRRPPAEDDESVMHVVAPSPRREISASHLEVAVVDGELRGRDLHSTNGTVVRTTARPPRLLHDGQTTALHSGDILDIGEEFSLVIGTKK